MSQRVVKPIPLSPVRNRDVHGIELLVLTQPITCTCTVRGFPNNFISHMTPCCNLGSNNSHICTLTLSDKVAHFSHLLAAATPRESRLYARGIAWVPRGRVPRSKSPRQHFTCRGTSRLHAALHFAFSRRFYPLSPLSKALNRC